MVRKDPRWPMHLRTKAKLEILHSYLGKWFGILANSGFPHVYYIDGFCGPGEYAGDEEGSPVIAAHYANSTAQKYPSFKATLIFIDKDIKALEHLKSIEAIKKPHPNVTIEIKEGVFIDELENIVETLKQNPRSPTFSFIDPFGFGHTPYEKIKLLMHNNSSEIFVNFMCGFMNRFKEHPDKEVVNKIKAMVGEDDLQTIIDDPEPIDQFCEAFERKLKDIGDFTLKFMMRDAKHIRDNAFFFCGRNSKGFEKVKEAMWKVDPLHGNAFLAHRELNKDTTQADLFGEAGSQTHELSKLIFDQFKGQKDVPVKDIFC